MWNIPVHVMNHCQAPTEEFGKPHWQIPGVRECLGKRGPAQSRKESHVFQPAGRVFSSIGSPNTKIGYLIISWMDALHGIGSPHFL